MFHNEKINILTIAICQNGIKGVQKYCHLLRREVPDIFDFLHVKYFNLNKSKDYVTLRKLINMKNSISQKFKTTLKHQNV